MVPSYFHTIPLEYVIIRLVLTMREERFIQVGQRGGYLCVCVCVCVYTNSEIRSACLGDSIDP